VEAVTPDIDRLIDDMIETMYAAPGVGLAAPQVGVALRIFVVDVSVGRDPGGLFTFVNPEFVQRDGMQLEEEGCLSVPGFNATVVRPSHAVLKGWIGTATLSRSKDQDCSRVRSSTRWIIWTAHCSWIACAAEARHHRPEDSQVDTRRQMVTTAGLRVVFFGTPTSPFPRSTPFSNRATRSSPSSHNRIARADAGTKRRSAR
jgi:hypothetical protein